MRSVRIFIYCLSITFQKEHVRESQHSRIGAGVSAASSRTGCPGYGALRYSRTDDRGWPNTRRVQNINGGVS